MSTKEKANLARIRDNQRRSRARRKEYLQELEARVRQCELQGIEASTEIQLAARRVADENKKLRGLLVLNGVSEDSIEQHLQDSPTGDTIVGGSSASVQALEQLLQTRKTCCVDGNNPMPLSGNAGIESRGSSCSTSTSTVQSAWDPIFTPPPRTLPSNGMAASSTHQFMTSSASTASRSSSVVSGQNSRSMYPQYQMSSVQMPRNPGHHPLSTRNQQMFEFVDTQISLATQRHSQSADDSRRLLQSQSSSDQGSGMNMKSCGYATDMITSMAGVDPGLVRADLGCPDPSLECEVDNHLVFDIMDHYTGSAGL